mmetsp:Transcript_49263/g.136918  ORF Transcript_49263/g.136918 Transcript_49263/m.136918 type:complete len:262 (-) Transcript_49263:740-1525(-)
MATPAPALAGRSQAVPRLEPAHQVLDLHPLELVSPVPPRGGPSMTGCRGGAAASQTPLHRPAPLGAATRERRVCSPSPLCQRGLPAAAALAPGVAAHPAGAPHPRVGRPAGCAHPSRPSVRPRRRRALGTVPGGGPRGLRVRGRRPWESLPGPPVRPASALQPPLVTAPAPRPFGRLLLRPPGAGWHLQPTPAPAPAAGCAGPHPRQASAAPPAALRTSSALLPDPRQAAARQSPRGAPCALEEPWRAPLHAALCTALPLL